MIEVPTSTLGPNPIGLWHRTVDGASGTSVRPTRGARPSQAVFLAGDRKADFLASAPKDDAQFIPVFAHSLEHTGGYSPDEATRVAGTLLPDILLYDPSQPAVFPHNGRALTDDAIDVFLGILTNGRITSDNVELHTDLLSEFPFLGAPHEDRSAHQVAA